MKLAADKASIVAGEESNKAIFLDLNEKLSGLADALATHSLSLANNKAVFNNNISMHDTNFGSPFSSDGNDLVETSPENTSRFNWDAYKAFIDSPTIIPQTQDDSDRRAALRADFLKTLLKGIRDDNIEVRGFISIDDVDFDEWLKKHGASAELMQSPLVVSTINLSFQYPNGDLAQKPVMSASSYVQWVLRLLVYMEAPYLLFAAGTGETLITPLYDVLKARGVKFKFFHALTDVIYDSDKNKVLSVNMLRQAETQDGSDYKPLIKAQEIDAVSYTHLTLPTKA